MSQLTITTIDGSKGRLDGAAVDGLAARMRGSVLRAGDAGYDDARTIWNAMIDRRPAVIARCDGAADVVEAVRMATDRNVRLAVRGAGHNIAGNALCDGGLVCDLSQMRSVRVDPDRRRASVEPGATLADFDREVQAFGLATPVGINSTTGVGGLTLGGGFGWLTRRYGLTVDNLVSAEVVTAAGERIRASAEEHPDLFWALRGGGGNFGVVTSFEFDLHPVGPQVLAGLVVYPFERAGDRLRWYREFVRAAPDDLTCWAVLRKAPPLPFLPESVHGREVLIFAFCHAGDPAQGEKLVAEMRALGGAHGEHVGVMPFTDWQAAFDPLLTPGARNYWKSHDFLEIGDAVVEQVLDHGARLPSDECEIFIASLGGAMSRVAADATAFPQRSAHFTMNVHTRWRDPEHDDACIGWARAFFESTAPHAAGTVYVNFMPADENDAVERAYGANWSRLAEVKRRYDPGNLFRVNQNVRPAA